MRLHTHFQLFHPTIEQINRVFQRRLATPNDEGKLVAVEDGFATDTRMHTLAVLMAVAEKKEHTFSTKRPKRKKISKRG
jgi:hypothetical protein